MSERLEALVDELQRVAADGAITDAELLGRLLQSRDPAALELVVWRHGSMVQAVCRRVLGPSPEIDDAFQATFLVLLRKARSIRQRESLAGWLHRVALRVAQRALRGSMARRRREAAAARPEALPPARLDQCDVGPLLHAEIDRLPERLRVAFVLCHLEGKTNEEAARLLGVPHGTILSRLSRARERLRSHLLRRGVAPAAALGAMLHEAEPVAAALVDGAVRGVVNDLTGGAGGPAAALAQGVLHMMVLRKLTVATAGVLAASLVLGLSLTTVPRLVGTAQADEKPVAAKPNETPDDVKPPANPDKPRADKPADPPPAPLDLLVPKKPLKVHHEDEARIIGTWSVYEIIADGEPRDPQEIILQIGPFGTMMVHDERALKLGQPMSYKLDPMANPPSIALTSGGKSQPCIYQVQGNDGLKLAMSLTGDKLPTDFNGDRGLNTVLMWLRRITYSCETKWANGLFVKGRTHDFGQVERGAGKKMTFTWKNIYDRPVGIVGVTYDPLKHDGFHPGGPMGPLGGGAAGPGGSAPMGGGGGLGPQGPGVDPEQARLASSPYWAVANPLTSAWVLPGEESEITITAKGNDLFGAAELRISIQFQVKGLDRRSAGGGFDRGGDAASMGPGGMGPPGGAPFGGGFASRRGRGIEAVTSTAELILTAKPVAAPKD